MFWSRLAARPRRSSPSVFAAVLFVAFQSVASCTTADERVTMVEEDWVLVVGQADPDTNAPQISTVFSPLGDLDGFYAGFTLNHRTIPSYAAGGMQLQIWYNETPLVQKTANESALLSTTGETVRWTQRLSLAGNVLHYEVADGTSDTWGAFGDGQLKISTLTNLTDLGSYRTDVSSSNSGIGFAANRVQSLKINRVRRYSGSTLLSETTTPVTVYEKP